jgi:hypothetical protein
MGHLVLFVCCGFGPVQAQQFSGHLYKEASRLGFGEFSCLVENYHVLHRVSSLRGNGAAVLYLIKIAARVLALSRIIELWFEAW